MWKAVLTICVHLLLSAVTFAVEVQANHEIKILLSACMEQVRQRVPDECAKVDNIRKEYGLGLIPYLEDYVTDACSLVRWQAYRSMILIGLDTEELRMRKEIVEKLLGRIDDDPSNDGYLSNRLLQFSAADFSATSRQMVRAQIGQALKDGTEFEQRDFILLAGVADLKSELPRLQSLIDEKEEGLKRNRAEELEEQKKRILMRGKSPSRWERVVLGKQWWEKSLVWAALRARARMGGKEDIARCIQLVDTHPNEDYKVRSFLTELAYVRQPQVVDYLRNYLNSNEKEPDDPPDVIGEAYASRAARALSEMLRGFPNKKGRGADPGTIERCRQWMTQQKEWHIIR
ncbi:MAG: hypothetical protein ACYTEX_24805 [Planctomycetota bacterium]|jgi:hypothetical protein